MLNANDDKLDPDRATRIAGEDWVGYGTEMCTHAVWGMVHANDAETLDKVSGAFGPTAFERENGNYKRADPIYTGDADKIQRNGATTRPLLVRLFGECDH